MLRSLAIGCAAICLVGCSEAQTKDEPIQTVERSFEVPHDTRDATYYIRPEMSVPAEADYSRGDVARDTYGRPYMYEYLGKTLPAFDARFENGEPFSSSDMLGKWTVIRVWGLWCHDSRGELKEAADLAKRLGAEEYVDFISLHVPQNSNLSQRALRGYDSLTTFFEEAGYSYPTLMDEDASLRDTLKIRWTPTYLVIAPDLSVQGFRTSLADAGDGSVDAFLQNIALTRSIWESGD